MITSPVSSAREDEARTKSGNSCSIHTRPPASQMLAAQCVTQMHRCFIPIGAGTGDDVVKRSGSVRQGESHARSRPAMSPTCYEQLTAMSEILADDVQALRAALQGGHDRVSVTLELLRKERKEGFRPA